MSANRVERLVYWYLRFNGYLTVENFTVHPDFKKGREAEADFLAVRFPWSKEEPRGYHFERDEEFVLSDRVDFVIGEVKSSQCAINENSWGNQEERHVQYALEWMGFCSGPEEIEKIAKTLYESRVWSDGKYSVRFVCFGRYVNEQLKEEFPKMRQVCLERMVGFVYKRLTTGCNALHRENWDPFIRRIVELMKLGLGPDKILEWVLMKEIQ